jgi:hypothetical protein
VIVVLAALDRAAFDAVTILGHNLLGSRSSFGLPAITDFGARIEHTAGDADVEVTRRWAAKRSTDLDPT